MATALEALTTLRTLIQQRRHDNLATPATEDSSPDMWGKHAAYGDVINCINEMMTTGDGGPVVPTAPY